MAAFQTRREEPKSHWPGTKASQFMFRVCFWTSWLSWRCHKQSPESEDFWQSSYQASDPGAGACARIALSHTLWCGAQLDWCPCVLRKTDLANQLKQALKTGGKQSKVLVTKKRCIKALQEEWVPLACCVISFTAETVSNLQMAQAKVLAIKQKRTRRFWKNSKSSALWCCACACLHFVSTPPSPQSLQAGRSTIAGLQAQIKSLNSDAKRNKNTIQSLEMDFANAAGDLSEKDLRKMTWHVSAGLRMTKLAGHVGWVFDWKDWQDTIPGSSLQADRLQGCIAKAAKGVSHWYWSLMLHNALTRLPYHSFGILKEGYEKLDDKLDNRDKEWAGMWQTYPSCTCWTRPVSLQVKTSRPRLKISNHCEANTLPLRITFSPRVFHYYSPEPSNESEQLRNVTAMYEKYKQKVEELEKATISPQANHIPLWVQELPYSELPALLMEIMGDISWKQITVQLLNRLAWFAAQDEDILDSHNNVMPMNNIGNAALSFVPSTSHNLHASAWSLVTAITNHKDHLLN
jgi:hypothetical protein